MAPEPPRPPEPNDLAAFFEHPVLRMALAVGCSILVMSWFSKHVLPRPIGYLPGAFPPLLGALYEIARRRYPGRPIAESGYWVAAILVATALVVAAHAR